MEFTKKLKFLHSDPHEVYMEVEIEFTDGHLSICGSTKNTGGQNRNELDDVIASASPDVDIPRLKAIWERWHLNDLIAGSPKQMEHLGNTELEVGYPDSWYDKASEELTRVGLNPDPEYIHEGEAYKFGHAWLREEVPADVLDFLANLSEEAPTIGA